MILRISHTADNPIGLSANRYPKATKRPLIHPSLATRLALSELYLMGMPGFFYRWYFGAHALKLLKRNILQFIGITPVRSTIYGMIEAVSAEKRKQWLREVEALGYDAR